MSNKVAMSTQVQELPDKPPINTKVEEDPVITDVINEMEKEFITSPRQFSMPQSQAHIAIPTYTTMPTAIPIHMSYTQNNTLYGLDKKHMQIAILASGLAFAIFYPIETEFLYEKVTILSKFAPYDRLIRALLLAVLLYILLWKLT